MISPVAFVRALATGHGHQDNKALVPLQESLRILKKICCDDFLIKENNEFGAQAPSPAFEEFVSSAAGGTSTPASKNRLAGDPGGFCPWGLAEGPLPRVTHSERSEDSAVPPAWQVHGFPMPGRLIDLFVQSSMPVRLQRVRAKKFPAMEA